MHPLIYIPRRRLIPPEECLGYACPRGADPRLGLGVGLGRRRRGGFSPTKVLGSLGAWWNFTDTTLITRNTQPTLVDGDMEAAGTAAWAASSSAILSKETTDPYKGAQCLRITEGGANNPTGSQNILITGNRYVLSGHGRKVDAQARIYIGTHPNTIVTTSTSWTDLHAEHTANSSSLMLMAYCSAGSGLSAEFDDITLENLSVTQADPVAATGGLAGSALVQATAASMPWENDGLYTDGSADDADSDAAASVWKFLHGAAGATIAGYVEPSSSGTLFSTLRITNSRHGVQAAWSSATNLLTVLMGNGSGTYVINTTAATPLTGGFTYVIRHGSGVYDVRINGISVASGSLTGSPSATDSYAPLAVGSANGTAFFGGRSDHLFVRQGAVSDAVAARLERAFTP